MPKIIKKKGQEGVNFQSDHYPDNVDVWCKTDIKTVPLNDERRSSPKKWQIYGKFCYRIAVLSIKAIFCSSGKSKI